MNILGNNFVYKLNYNSWSRLIQIVVEVKPKLGFINGSYNKCSDKYDMILYF